MNEVGGKIPGSYYQFIGYNKNPDKHAEINQSVTNIFEKLNQNIVGPYVLGE